MALVVPENEVLAEWTDEGRSHYWMAQAEMCKACRSMHHFFVNANGRTTCIGCAPKEGQP